MPPQTPMRHAILAASVGEVCRLNACTVLSRLEMWRNLDQMNPSIHRSTTGNMVILDYDCGDRICEVSLSKDEDGNWIPDKPETPSE